MTNWYKRNFEASNATQVSLTLVNVTWLHWTIELTTSFCQVGVGWCKPWKPNQSFIVYCCLLTIYENLVYWYKQTIWTMYCMYLFIFWIFWFFLWIYSFEFWILNLFFPLHNRSLHYYCILGWDGERVPNGRYHNGGDKDTWSHLWFVGRLAMIVTIF